MKALQFYVLAGPTAVGKSELAVEIAERLKTEIVGADAFQLYHGFKILSGKPSAALESRIKHHLVGLLPITEACDAARYAALAGKVIRNLNQGGLIPLVVGGSGFYIQALVDPLPELPPGNLELRNRLAEAPFASLLSFLEHFDPETFAVIDRHNRRRVERAVEVIQCTGKPFSAHRRPKTTGQLLPGLVVTRSRADLHARINQRVRWMLDNGAIEEVASADQIGPTASQMIGIPEIKRLLNHEISLEECVRLMQASTRQYAKRQITWFKKQSFAPFAPERPVDEAVHFFLRHTTP